MLLRSWDGFLTSVPPSSTSLHLQRGEFLEVVAGARIGLFHCPAPPIDNVVFIIPLALQKPFLSIKTGPRFRSRQRPEIRFMKQIQEVIYLLRRNRQRLLPWSIFIFYLAVRTFRDQRSGTVGAHHQANNQARPEGGHSQETIHGILAPAFSFY